MNSLTLLVNTEEHLLSQILNYHFNSFCEFGGKILAAGDEGIFELDSADSDDGRDIWAVLELPKFDLGYDKNKIIRKIHLNLRSNGETILTCYVDDKPEVTYLLESTHGEWKKIEEPGDRSAVGSDVQIRFENLDGSDFSLNSISSDIILRTI